MTTYSSENQHHSHSADIAKQLADIDWQQVGDDLSRAGYAVISAFLNAPQCQFLIDHFDAEHGFRKTVDMARYRFGLGHYKYWDYPLPGLIQSLREQLYPHLVPVANTWMENLQSDDRFPASFNELQTRCHQAGQEKPTPLILKYQEGGYNTLHQDLYGEVFFPLQAACFLSQPNEDYTGGEFVLTEQIPRAQSKVTVLQPSRGDMVIFTTNFRPVKGLKRYYRAKIRHGVSEVRSGQRLTAGIIFHDAQT